MGGLKKPKTATQQADTGRSKEIKIITKQVVTVNDIVKNPRAVKLLYIISQVQEGISEKALAYLIYTLEKEEGLNLGYNFAVIGNNPVSKELQNDLTSLKYTGLVELSPRNKKLYVTGSGKEFLEKYNELVKQEEESLKKAIANALPKVLPVDVEASLKASRK